MLHMMTLPLAAGVLLHTDARKQRQGLRRLVDLVEAIVKAEDSLERLPALQSLLTDLAFQDETLAREMMILIRAGGGDIDAPETQKAKQVMERFLGGSSSTKEILESTFAHLTDKVSRSNKNKRVNPLAL